MDKEQTKAELLSLLKRNQEIDSIPNKGEWMTQKKQNNAEMINLMQNFLDEHHLIIR